MAAQEQLSSMLHENQRRVLTMIDALPEAIYTTDAEGRVTHFNPAATSAPSFKEIYLIVRYPSLYFVQFTKKTFRSTSC